MTTATLEITSGSFDAYESAGGAVTVDGASINLTAGGQWGGLGYDAPIDLFDATINSATLRIYIVSTANDSPIMDVYLQKSLNCDTYAALTNDISDRPRTTNKASVNATNVGAGWYEITGLGPAVQEVIDQPSWVYGLFPILDPLPGCDINMRTYEYDPALAAELVIDYTPASGGVVGQVFGSPVFGTIVR